MVVELFHFADRFVDFFDRLADGSSGVGRGCGRVFRKLCAVDRVDHLAASGNIFDLGRGFQGRQPFLVEFGVQLRLAAAIIQSLLELDDPVFQHGVRRFLELAGQNPHGIEARLGGLNGGIVLIDGGGNALAVVGRKNERAQIALMGSHHEKADSGVAVLRSVAGMVRAGDRMAVSFCVDEIPLVGKLVGADGRARNGWGRDIGASRHKF